MGKQRNICQRSGEEADFLTLFEARRTIWDWRRKFNTSCQSQRSLELGDATSSISLPVRQARLRALPQPILKCLATTLKKKARPPLA